ncbi:hypothetical protein B0T25DRAFT_570211 [Lasiosphaeria hispida]|uniref:Uncharacterized protein n=1 Tax=Lasiosphaeria hispida TaxID=260671 RepID=A0AAJ0HEX3_9PEZI|nr:hypothetical protein B0T25DRAFT_570211 [Lasiosphaeria hispida]
MASIQNAINNGAAASYVYRAIDPVTKAAHDSQASVALGRAAQYHSCSIRTVTFLTLTFLPVTFISALFSMSFFTYEPEVGGGGGNWQLCGLLCHCGAGDGRGRGHVAGVAADLPAREVHRGHGYGGAGWCGDDRDGGVEQDSEWRGWE